MENAIEIKNLVVAYGPKRALDGLSLSVEKGKIFGFLGPNGAGKSTAIKTLLGLVPFYSGDVRVHGLSPADPRARARIGFLPEEATYYRFLTPLETLKFYGEIFSIPKAELKTRIEKLLTLVGLFDVRNKPIRTFSKGMAQKLSLAQALVNDPQTLILDEPASGLDPLARADLRRILHDLRNQGKTIFFSSHELSEAELVCDSIAILEAGRLVLSGSLKEVLGDHRDKNLERFFIETVEAARK
ncbi:MAG: ABC transporter ATP-binding protein [Candidatus Omnitrophica bacterium]|nr:ABC transporter ATP-binding protein [Candidatus Omnitrophota bacterium]